MAEALGEIKGVVRGRTIELEEETGLPDGAVVMVRVKGQSDRPEKLPPGEGLRRAFGAWSGPGEEGLDEYLAWCREQRREAGRELEP
jgi:hypothetical protein